MKALVTHYGFFISDRTPKKDRVTGSSRFLSASDVVSGKLIRKYLISKKEEVGICTESEKLKIPKTYKMNTSYFRKKAIAYSLLRQSMRFLAFYTISFPKGMPDDSCYRIFNTVLTRMRKDLGLKSYLWCMERQKNGTVHYHLLTNDYMVVQEVNRYTAVCIDNEIKKGNGSWGNSSLSKYNGVDVKAVNRKSDQVLPKKEETTITKVVGYLSKYMSKDTQSSSHRVWHCSRLVSALFTATWQETSYLEYMAREEREKELGTKTVVCKFGTMIFTKQIPIKYGYFEVMMLNDRVYDMFEKEGFW